MKIKHKCIYLLILLTIELLWGTDMPPIQRLHDVPLGIGFYANPCLVSHLGHQ